MKKGLIISISIAVTVVVAITVFALVWYFGKSYKNFSAHAKEEWQIPGLKQGFTPQGIWKDGENNLTCGYMKDGSASRIYLVSKNSVKYFTLKQDNSDFTGHCGGIVTYKGYGYIACDKKVYIFDYNQSLTLGNGKSTQILKVIDAPNGADFINVYQDKMYIGEFYHQKKYPTKQEHKINCADGVNPAVTYVYSLSDQNEYFIDKNPSFAISTTEKIQGMCFTDSGNIVLSQSWSLADSHILAYKPLDQVKKQKFNYNNLRIDLYVLDSQSLICDITAPCMSEEIIFTNGRLYIMFENACKKYSYVTRTRLKNVYSLDIQKFIK